MCDGDMVCYNRDAGSGRTQGGETVETIKLHIGTVERGNAFTQDNTRAVEFVGELVMSRTEYGYDDRTAKLSDTRGVTESLYKSEDGRLLVYTEDWSRWQGEPTTTSLHQVTEADLQIGGQYEALGHEAGYGRPLTLDEALAND